MARLPMSRRLMKTAGSLRIGKVLSTPDRLVDGIEGGVAKAEMEFAAAGLFLHGSTIAVNTILERTGAKTAAYHHRRIP